MARLVVRVRPGARRTGFVGWFGDIPKLAVSARPEGGEANEEVVRAVARACGLRPRDVRLVGGAASRTKRLDVEGLTTAELAVRIADANPRRAP
ncbi:MAG: DUF167 domain-containing protein [Ilumatobacter sp.]|uniref:DUF167 domain-containing protein n=1 Tax=Ilumatobacter sp. TaxID=1967498 RepID=UPI002618362D|nr:DUF167 domain-containing protein [Ilumatobacter sp.]MDJ0767549.1 DUF167 domain-containing protein [Ilumatobacter sp.]